jgi:mono/diheme cytochrome c family protein
MRLPAEGLSFPQRKESVMSTIKIALLVLAMALALFMIFPNLSWAAEDGASLYKAKCRACHGVEGGGKSAAALSGGVVSQRVNR